MTIRELRREDYKGKIYTFSYVTHGFYSICAAPGGFSVKYTPLPAPVEKSFQDELFSPWLEAPRLYGAFEGNVLAGFVEGSPESWNHRFRITNLLVMEPFRGRGIGGALLEHMVAVAQAHGARMAVLEAQSCNTAAIRFYLRHGFSMIGLDLYAYSNQDPQRGEVRVEMGRMLADF